jgi:hypothetical protein
MKFLIDIYLDSWDDGDGRTEEEVLKNFIEEKLDISAGYVKVEKYEKKENNSISPVMDKNFKKWFNTFVDAYSGPFLDDIEELEYVFLRAIETYVKEK